MNIRSLEQKFNKLTELISNQHADKYTCSRDEDYNLILTFNDGEVTKLPFFELRNYQIEVQKALFRDGTKRFLLCRPRRAGKEVESFTMLIESAIETPGLYLMIYPTTVRAKGVLWDGNIILKDGTSMPFLEMIPKRLIKGKPNKNELKVYLKNGAVIWILGSDVDPDKLRGTNARGTVISEAAYSDPRVMHILMPVLTQNGGWLICQSTFNGVNHFYKLWQRVKENKEWYVSVDSIETLKDDNGNRYITDEMVDLDRQAGMPEFLIKQEYYSEVQLNEESLFFSREIQFMHENQKLVSGIILHGEPVFTFWDLGVNDACSVLYVQFDAQNNPVIIGHIEECNRNIDYFVDQARHFCARNGLSLHSHFTPHDGANRDKTSGGSSYRPVSFVDIGRKLGEVFTTVTRPNRKIDAINLMRKMLYRTTFNEENTIRLIECLSNYGKEFDAKHGVYKEMPFPKWTTNSVDSFQTMTLALEGNMIQNRSTEIVYYDDE
jgi:hypothetical protein